MRRVLGVLVLVMLVFASLLSYQPRLDAAEGTPVELPFGEPTAAPGQPEQVGEQVGRPEDDVNQSGAILESLDSASLWIGNSSGGTTDFTGIRFGFVAVPQGVVVTSATLEVYATQASWINSSWIIYGDSNPQSPEFSLTAMPSQRLLTTANTGLTDNTNWTVGWHTIGNVLPIVRELVANPLRKYPDPMTFIVRGTGGSYARRFVDSFDGNISNSPRLRITYIKPLLATPTVVSPIDTPTADTPTPMATSTPVSTPVPTPSDTPIPATATAVVATATPAPTETPIPPTAIATDTPVPTSTSAPESPTPTETPAVLGIEATKSPKVSWDVNGDGVVNHLDVSAIDSSWGATGLPNFIPEDVNGDGIVGMQDMSIVIDHWHQHSP